MLRMLYCTIVNSVAMRHMNVKPASIVGLASGSAHLTGCTNFDMTCQCTHAHVFGPVVARCICQAFH